MGTPEWQPSVISTITFSIFEMAAMPFPSNGILVVLDNLPRIFPSYASEGKRKKFHNSIHMF